MRSALVLALVVAAGCGGGDGEDDARDGYPDRAVASFVEECRAQPNATDAACRCVIGRLEASMPYDEFRRADEALRADRAPAKASVEKLEAAARACLAGAGPP